MRYNRKWLTAVAFCLIISIVAAQVSFHELARAEKGETIRVAGDKNFPPFEYVGDSGVYTGFNIDIMNAISIETGVKIEYEPMPWNEAIEALRSGKIDAIQGMKYSKARDQIFDFSEAYFISSQGIFVLADNAFIFHLDDLLGRKIAVQKGDIANDFLRKWKNVTLIEANSQEDAIQYLLQGKVDAFVGNRYTGQYFLQKKNQQSLIKIVGEPIHPTDYGIAVMPQNKRLLSILNTGISQIKSNGTYEKIQRKWLGEYIQPSSSRLRTILQYLEIGLAASILIFLAVFWWNRMLKKEVSRRTEQIASMNQQLEEKMTLLQENVEFQQQLLDSTYSFFVTLDVSAKIMMMNRQAVQYLQLSRSLIGKQYESSVLAEFIPIAEVTDALLNGTAYLQKEHLWEPSPPLDSEQRIIHYNIIPITNTSREITGVIINFRDITTQKDLEKKMEQEDRLSSLGQLTLGIAHEIRNPLMAILTYTQLLPKKFDNPRFRDFFAQEVPGEIQRLNSLVNDLFDYARPKPSNPVPFSLDEQVEAVIQLCNQRMKEKKITVTFEWQQKPLIARVDVHQAKQIWINLILNALDAMETGGKLTIRGYMCEQMTVIEVEDNGSGFSHEEKYKIFEPFYSTKQSGVGLGLSITYRLITENQGKIDVKSKRGSGTTMIVKLPAPEEGMNAYASSDRY